MLRGELAQSLVDESLDRADGGRARDRALERQPLDGMDAADAHLRSITAELINGAREVFIAIVRIQTIFIHFFFDCRRLRQALGGDADESEVRNQQTADAKKHRQGDSADSLVCTRCGQNDDSHGEDENDHDDPDRLSLEVVFVFAGGLHLPPVCGHEAMRPAAIGTVQGFIDERLSKLSAEQRSGTLPVDIQAAQGVVGRMMAWQAYPARR